MSSRSLLVLFPLSVAITDCALSHHAVPCDVLPWSESATCRYVGPDVSEGGSELGSDANDGSDALTDAVHVADADGTVGPDVLDEAADAADAADVLPDLPDMLAPDAVDVPSDVLSEAADVVDAPTDVADVSADVPADVPDDAARDASVDGPADAGGPNLVIRYTASTSPVVLFLEVSPFASLTQVNLAPASCLGGLRVVGSGVECDVTMPEAGSSQIRFNFSLVASYPTRDDQWLCNGSTCPGFPGSYAVDFRGSTVPSSTYGIGLLVDSHGTSTHYLAVTLPP